MSSGSASLFDLVAVVAVVVVVAVVLLRKTRFGRYVYAVGGKIARIEVLAEARP